MSIHDLSAHRHNHAFDSGNRSGERGTWIVVAIAGVTMVAEIVGGLVTGSMALLADGWHMATHVAALSIAGVAYRLARRWASDTRFAFGTWKIEVLGAFTSALLLGAIALAMIVESVLRLARPTAVDFGPALAVAAIGLVVNLVSAWVLHGRGEHAHAHDPGGHDHGGHDHGGRDHGHHHAPHPGHADLNLASAYLHVITDALTSVLAIVALAVGYFGGGAWLDPAMGIVGGLVIAWWSRGLLVQSARVLLDREMDAPVVRQLRESIESDGDAEISDLHVWRVGRESYAAVVTVVARDPLTPDEYRRRVAGLDSLAHVSVEVNRCERHHECP